jgi:CHAD domain-containing protein
MEPALERELKLEVPDDFSLIRLAERLGPFRLSEPELHRLHTTYYDTADLRLARWGASLRYRQGEGWTLKLPQPLKNGAAYRTEHTFAGNSDEIPVEALDLAAALLRGQPPQALADLRTIRTQRDVRIDDGTPLAEVSEDDVRVLRSNEVVNHFRQLEVELRPAVPDSVLPRLAKQLRKRGAGKANPVTKAAIALNGTTPIPELSGTPPPRTATIFELVRAALSGSVDRLVRLDPVLRAEPGVDAMHDARVAVRKLRSHLRTFEPVTDAAWNAELGESLRWLGDVLGAARDADVLLGVLSKIAEDLPPTDRRHVEDALAPFRQRREAAYAAVGRALREPRYARAIEAAIAGANAPRVAQPQRSAATLVPHLMQRVWKKLRKRVRRSGSQPTDRDLHRIRIQAKHVRYAAEAFTPIGGAKARRFARRAEALQDLLGKLHDAVTASTAVREQLGPSAEAFRGGEFAAIERANAARLRGRFPNCWRRLARPKRRRFWR